MEKSLWHTGRNLSVISGHGEVSRQNAACHLTKALTFFPIPSEFGPLSLCNQCLTQLESRYWGFQKHALPFLWEININTLHNTIKLIWISKLHTKRALHYYWRSCLLLMLFMLWDIDETLQTCESIHESFNSRVFFFESNFSTRKPFFFSCMKGSFIISISKAQSFSTP